MQRSVIKITAANMQAGTQVLHEDPANKVAKDKPGVQAKAEQCSGKLDLFI